MRGFWNVEKEIKKKKSKTKDQIEMYGKRDKRKSRKYSRYVYFYSWNVENVRIWSEKNDEEGKERWAIVNNEIVEFRGNFFGARDMFLISRIQGMVSSTSYFYQGRRSWLPSLLSLNLYFSFFFNGAAHHPSRSNATLLERNCVFVGFRSLVESSTNRYDQLINDRVNGDSLFTR